MTTLNCKARPTYHKRPMLVETGGANPGAKQKTEGAMAPPGPPLESPLPGAAGCRPLS